MIRFIIEHLSSRRDVNGNCYWISIVISTKTSGRIMFTTPHYSNTESLLRNAMEWSEMHSATTIDIPIRQFNEYRKNVDMHNSCKDPEVLKAVLALENGATS